MFLALCLALLPQDAAGASEPAFLELIVPDGPVHVGELVPVELRFGFEAGFVAGRLIQLFRQPLDLPVLLELPWPERRLLPPAEPPGSGLRFARSDGLGWAVLVGEEQRDGRRFQVFSHRLRLLTEDAGELSLAAPTLRFASATEFVDDLLNGRVPVDRVEGRADAEARTLQVLELPAAGRPEDFGGAVGRFTIAASVLDAELGAGQTLELRLRVEGEGWLEAVPAPALDALEGFHLLGQVREAAEDALLFRYELQPLAGAAPVLPPIELGYFDPEADRYRRARTEEIPLRFPGAAEPERTEPNREPGQAGAAGPSDPAAPPAAGGGDAVQPSTTTKLMMVALFLGPVALVGLIFLGWQRRRRQEAGRNEGPVAFGPTTPTSQPRSVPEPPRDPLEAHLAELLGCSAAALVRPDLALALRQVGLPPELADRCAEYHRHQVGLRYGAPGAAADPSAAVELLADLRARRS